MGIPYNIYQPYRYSSYNLGNSLTILSAVLQYIYYSMVAPVDQNLCDFMNHGVCSSHNIIIQLNPHSHLSNSMVDHVILITIKAQHTYRDYNNQHTL